MESWITHIIITAPNISTANVYNQQLDILRRRSHNLKVAIALCVEDPADGVRIGSGGGTLNSLDYLINSCGKDALLTAKIVLVHSGGDSRRSPLHSICGKAWASLNSSANVMSPATPIALLIEEINSFCCNVGPGSLIIACSDVMLNIAMVKSLFHIVASIQSYILD